MSSIEYRMKSRPHNDQESIGNSAIESGSNVHGESQVSACDELAMKEAGEKLALSFEGGEIIYLTGCLGAGKTTLTAGILRGLGHPGAVKSPTYTLVEPYDLERFQVYHFDLYRLGDPEELEYIGIREYTDHNAICILEWPERGLGFIPSPDLVIRIEMAAVGRSLIMQAKTPKGTRMISR